MTDKTPAIDRNAIAKHLELLFGKKAKGFVCLRGIGEKGTEREGIFREDIFLEPSALGWDNFVGSVFNHAFRWGSHNVATFIVPCTLKAERVLPRIAMYSLRPVPTLTPVILKRS